MYMSSDITENLSVAKLLLPNKIPNEYFNQTPNKKHLLDRFTAQHIC